MPSAHMQGVSVNKKLKQSPVALECNSIHCIRMCSASNPTDFFHEILILITVFEPWFMEGFLDKVLGKNLWAFSKLYFGKKPWAQSKNTFHSIYSILDYEGQSKNLPQQNPETEDCALKIPCISSVPSDYEIWGSV